MKIGTIGIVAAALAASVVGAGAASAQKRIYMKMDGVVAKNDQATKGHEGQIALTSIYSGINTPIDGSPIPGARVGRVVLSEASVTKLMDATSVKLRDMAVKGTVAKTVEITYCKSTKDKEQCYYTLTLRDVVISNIDHGMSAGEDDPTESLTLSAQGAAWKYQAFDAAGMATGAPVEASTK